MADTHAYRTLVLAEESDLGLRKSIFGFTFYLKTIAASPEVANAAGTKLLYVSNPVMFTSETRALCRSQEAGAGVTQGLSPSQQSQPVLGFSGIILFS